MTPVGHPPAATVGLRFKYSDSREPVLNDLNISFPAGTVTAITGRSGSGKSTLLYLLGLLLSPTQGDVTLAGQTTAILSDYSRSQLRGSHIGFLFQDSLLDPTRTLLDNVIEGALFAGLSPSRMRGTAVDLLNQLGLDTTMVSRRLPSAISGGEAQRVALCRALIKRPAIVLADEPTGNLDADSSQVVLETLIQTAASGASVIIATHDGSIARAADQMVSLD